MRTINVPPHLLELAGQQAGLVAARQCDRAGIGPNTRTRLVASGGWRRIRHAVYSVPGVVAAPRKTSERWSQRHARQVWTTLLAGPDDAMPVGLTALSVHDIWGLPWNLGCEVSYGAGRHARGARGIRVRQFGQPLGTTVIGGRTVPTVAGALVQALPEIGRDLAVVLLDNALNRRKISETDLELIQRSVKGRRGAARLHVVWPLVDGRSESPLETRARLECVDAGLPPDRLQIEVFDGPVFLGRGDLGWRRRNGGWVLVEMDGDEVHGTARAISSDRHRQNGLSSRTSKLTLLRYTSEDLGTGIILDDIRRALAT